MILEAKGVYKKYFKKQVLSGIDMSIEKGKVVGLLGPNGSGKTTFLKMLAGLVKPSKGSVKICGNEIGYKTKNIVAYMPDSDFIYDWMKLCDTKRLYKEFYKDFCTDRFDELVEFMKVPSELKFKGFSKGMKEKLGLALILSRNAKFIVLDEPLNGVEPVAREQIIGSILKGFSFESSILITSHLIRDVESILDEVYYIKEGEIVLSGNSEELRIEKSKTLDELYMEVFSS